MSDGRAADLNRRLSALSPLKRSLLSQWARGRMQAAPSPAVRVRTGPLPLSYGQQRLWMMNRMAGSPDAYNVPAVIRLQSPLDASLLEDSLNALIARHESLRTSFIETGGVPTQVIAEAARISVQVHDVHVVPEDASRLITEYAIAPFNLAEGPLMRAGLLRLGGGEQILLLTFHHLIVDGWSLNVFFREFNAVYGALESARMVQLPHPGLQYTDYVEWQREWLRTSEAAAQEAYWLRLLSGIEDLELPIDRPRPAVLSDRGSRLSATLPPELSTAVRRLGQSLRCTTFMVLLGAVGSLLARYSGQYDFAIGVPAAGRTDSRWESIIGVFLNTLLLRLDLSGNPTFRQILASVREITLDAYSNQDLPVECVQKAGRPAFNVFFNLLNFGEVQSRAATPAAAAVHAPFDLSFYATEHGGRISISAVYREALFEAASMSRMLEHLTSLLEAVTANPKLTLASVPLPVAEPVPSHGLSAGRGEAGTSITERFDEQAAAHAQRTALASAHGRWTYARLREESCRIRGLIEARCGPGPGRIGVLFGHEPLAIASILGVLRSGKCYVPLDVEDPEERLVQIAAEADLEAILTGAANIDRARALARGRCELLAASEAASYRPGGVPRAQHDAAAPAYVLFTSGSSGRPKGVVQSHRGVLGHIRAYSDALSITPADRLSLVASLGVDAAVMDIFGALLNGATLCMLDVRRGGLEDLPSWICASGITVYHSTPTIYR